mgnify:CR=1 FL=1
MPSAGLTTEGARAARSFSARSALYWMALSSCSSMLATGLNSEIARICGAACVPLEDRAVSLVAKSTSTVAASGETGASTSAGAWNRDADQLTVIDGRGLPSYSTPRRRPATFPLRRDGGTWARASMAVAITAAIAGPACEGLSQLKAYR